MVISRIIALVYDPVKPCCFNSQVNIYLDDFQLSKTVFILARFCPKKLFISADKGCLILVPRSDLFRPRDLKYRISCPFSAKMQWFIVLKHFCLIILGVTLYFNGHGIFDCISRACLSKSMCGHRTVDVPHR